MADQQGMGRPTMGGAMPRQPMAMPASGLQQAPGAPPTQTMGQMPRLSALPAQQPMQTGQQAPWGGMKPPQQQAMQGLRALGA